MPVPKRIVMRVLVVDDDATNRLVIKGLLSKESHEVIMAADGQEALDQFQAERPELVLMDVMMPVMDGYEATRRIKEICQDDFVPVIFLTAMTGDEALVACLENGGDDYLNKPINRVVLSAKMKAMSRIRDLYQTVNQQKQALAIQQQRVRHEQEVAEKIFNNIMNKGDLALPVIKTYRKSAEAFNGDIVLAARTPDGGINVLVGDFTGHGLAAAIGAIPVSDTFYAMTAKNIPLEDIVFEINGKLRYLLPPGRFLAATVFHIDMKCTKITLWNGGMPELLIIGSDNKVKDRIMPLHTPIGILAPVEFDSKTASIAIEPGDKIVVFSDGVTETTNREEAMFGLERLEAAISNCPGDRNLVDVVIESLDVFRENTEQADDITLLEFICDPQTIIDSVLTPNVARAHQNPSSVWSMDIRLESDTLKRLDPIPFLLKALNDIQSVRSHSENLFLILSELYNNALEHGLLKLDSSMKASPEGFSQYYIERQKRLEMLDSGSISIHVKNEPTAGGGCLTFQITDSGEGFVKNATDRALEADTIASGRGIPLIRRICKDVWYNESGNSVTALYDWQLQ